jgi:hypothetical protein
VSAGEHTEGGQGGNIQWLRHITPADFHSTDRYNRPIFVQDLSYLKVNELLVHTTPDRIIRFFAFMLEDAVRHKYARCTEESRLKAGEAGVVDPEELKKIVIDDNFMILNVAGLGMGTFWAVSRSAVVAAKAGMG